MTKELTVSQKELSKMSSTQLETFAEEKSRYILGKLNSLLNEDPENGPLGLIATAKAAAKNAADNNNYHWYNRTKKKADATAKALINTNEAVAELADVVNESISFTKSSVLFARTMSQHISAMLSNGFKDVNGNYIKLSGESREQAEFILRQAQEFAENQEAVENQMYKHDEAIELNAKTIHSLVERIDEKDSIDKQQSERITSLSNENREQNKKLSDITSSLSEKEKIDAEQSQRLEELNALLTNKDLVDQKQEEAIAENKESIKILFEYTKQKDILDKEQSDEIEKIKESSTRKLCIIAIVISGISFITSAANIILGFIR